MKAIVLKGPDHYPDNYELMEIEKPDCRASEMVIKMKAAALCGTDKRIFTGAKTKGVRPNSVIGHEICGIVEEVGGDVEGFLPGDRVAIANVIPCGRCYCCLNGMENACIHRKAIGYEFDGGFAEFVRIPDICIRSGNVVTLPEHVSFEAGAMIEPLACCIRGLRNTGTEWNDTVLVIGGGPIGLMHVMLSLAVGAKKVLLSELDQSKREMARKLGASRVIDPASENLEQIVKEETGGQGADRIVMAIGVNALVDSVCKLSKKGGTVNLFAGFPNGKMSEIDPSVIHYNEVRVTGSTAYTRKDYLEAADMVISGKVDLDALVSARFPLKEFRTALDLHMEGSALKVVIVD